MIIFSHLFSYINIFLTLKPFYLIIWIILPILLVLFWNIQDLPVGYCVCQNASLRHWVHGSILVADLISGRIAELAGNRHNVCGAGNYDKPQWLFDVGFYFWCKGYILSDPLWCHLFYGLLFTSLFRDIQLVSFTINTKSNKTVKFHKYPGENLKNY